MKVVRLDYIVEREGNGKGTTAGWDKFNDWNDVLSGGEK